MDLWITWLQEQMALPLNFWRLIYIIFLVYMAAQILVIPLRIKRIQHTMTDILDELKKGGKI